MEKIFTSFMKLVSSVLVNNSYGLQFDHIWDNATPPNCLVHHISIHIFLILAYKLLAIFNKLHYHHIFIYLTYEIQEFICLSFIYLILN